MKPRVLICDPIGEEGIELMRKAGLEVDILGRKENLANVISNYEGVIVRSQTKVTAEIMNSAKKLKIIGRAGTGVDNIDMQAAQVKGIKVFNIPEANTNAACEHTLAMIFAMLRNIPQGHAGVKAGEWERDKLVGEELAGKTIGIVGFGRIGRLLAKKLSSLECSVRVYDTFIDKGAAASLGAKPVDIQVLLKESDIVTLHVPLSESTRHMIGANELAVMKKGSCLVNCARGGLVDEDALYEALKSGHLRGAALDVFEREPPAGSPLLSLSNVVLTPHLGASTAQAKRRVGIEVAKQMVLYLGSLQL